MTLVAVGTDIYGKITIGFTLLMKSFIMMDYYMMEVCMNKNNLKPHYHWPDVAERYGIIEAVFLQYLAIYINANYKNKNPVVWRDGFIWTFRNAEHLVDDIKGLTPWQIKKIINKLKSVNAIDVKYYSMPHNRCRWFTLIDPWLIDYLLDFKQPNPLFNLKAQSPDSQLFENNQKLVARTPRAGSQDSHIC
jgi:hypothetical protein